MSRVLIIDDEESICWGLSKLCEQLGVTSESASSAEKGLDLARQTPFDVVVMDVRLPGMDGLAAIEHFKQVLGDVPVITITAFGDLETAIQSVQKGAFEYIAKPFELGKVKSTLQQAIANRKIMQTLNVESVDRIDAGKSKRQISKAQGLVGASAIMQEVFKQIALTTTTHSPVLVTGESGTGKELTARTIHQFGPCAKGPFVAVNIAALSPTLAESELFGHVKGAFTGADTDRKGLIEQAHGGTLFLDEIAEIPLEIQVKLLRVLDLGEVTPVGSNQTIPTNFRLVSATHQNLLSQVNHGDFRHDLFYRLRALEIQLPALRTRSEDIPQLVSHFLRANETQLHVSESFLEALQRRPWPGNIRELQHVVQRAATMARGGVLTADHVESGGVSDIQADSATTNLDQALQNLIREWTRKHWNISVEGELYANLLTVVEQGCLPTAFELSSQQYSAAARKLGIHRTTLKKKLDEIGSGNID